LKLLTAWIKHLFKKKKVLDIEPLLHSNVETLFTEWSSGFGFSLPNGCDLTPSDVAGNYAIRGRNASSTGFDYFGTLSLQAKGNLIKAYWEIGHTRTPQHGFGFIKGDLVALDFYYTEESTRFYGQVIYKAIGETLVGFWRENHIGEIAPEEGTLKNRFV
jgi:hypothetical protein